MNIAGFSGVARMAYDDLVNVAFPEVVMRIAIAVLALLPLTAAAQYQQPEPPLYPYKKTAPPAVLYDGDQGGIPTDGTAMERKLKREQRERDRNAPTVIYRERGRDRPTIITGPDGTRICTDSYGRTVVCW